MDYFPIQGYYESNQHYYIEGRSYRYKNNTDIYNTDIHIIERHTVC